MRHPDRSVVLGILTATAACVQQGRTPLATVPCAVLVQQGITETRRHNHRRHVREAVILHPEAIVELALVHLEVRCALLVTSL